MQIETIGWIIGAFVLALLITFFQYNFRKKENRQKQLLLGFLRFLSIFFLLLLLINPSLKSKRIEVEKPVLALAVDHSSSIAHLKQEKTVEELVRAIINNEKLQERFDIQTYQFSETLEDSLSFDFKATQTDITGALEDLDQIYKNANAPVVLITDGNQTYGRDYQYQGNYLKQPVYPMIVGDTSAVEDIRIAQLNVNKYAYLKNKFPVELIATYSGKNSITTTLTIQSGKQTLYSNPVEFSEKINSKVITFSLPANRAGVVSYRAALKPIKNEVNTVNNFKNFAVEVIDQKTNISIVSSIVHPDLGAIKKSIESNERRSVTIKNPSEISSFEDYQLVILYQPSSRFQKIYSLLEKEKKNHFTITGSQTDWAFLNRIQQRYHKELIRQTEYYIPEFNPNYATFLIEDLGFEDYPPLIGFFGDISFKNSKDVLLYQNIENIITENPLLATLEQDNRREAILLGEGYWRWRAKCYLDTKSFEGIDDFMGRIIQYLASAKKRKRLNTIAESFYYGNAPIKIKAEYFTKNYEFDRRAKLSLFLKENKTEASKVIPMLLKNNTYEADVSNLAAGDYQYTVKVEGENLSESGNFTILEFDVEQQMQNATDHKLKQVARDTEGKSFYADQISLLMDELLNDPRYQAVQKSKENIVSLIDWKYLLFLLLLTLTLEWFIRKYTGLI